MPQTAILNKQSVGWLRERDGMSKSCVRFCSRGQPCRKRALHNLLSLINKHLVTYYLMFASCIYCRISFVLRSLSKRIVCACVCTLLTKLIRFGGEWIEKSGGHSQALTHRRTHARNGTRGEMHLCILLRRVSNIKALKWWCGSFEQWKVSPNIISTHTHTQAHDFAIVAMVCVGVCAFVCFAY